MSEIKEKITEIQLEKREVLMEDGERYLIYYTFSETERDSQTKENKEDV